MQNQFDHNGECWIWTRTDGSEIVLSDADVHDLEQMSHIAARMSNPRNGSYIKADAEHSW